MASLIFLITVLFLFVMFILLISKLFKGENVTHALRNIGILIGAYAAIWMFFFVIKKNIPVKFATEVCFDDWCASVKGAQFSPDMPDSDLVVVDINMINNAKGIAQTPSEPRLYLIDDAGNTWKWSAIGQKLVIKKWGLQPGIGHRLELHQSLGTKLAFIVPKHSKSLIAVIEEGPWITNLIFPASREVFKIK